MSTNELWALHEKVAGCLAKKMTVEKNALELRLKQLNRGNRDMQSAPPIRRRPYPRVVPKFQNPDHPAETWAGRGKQPRWLTTQLRSGKRLDEFLISRAAA